MTISDLNQPIIAGTGIFTLDVIPKPEEETYHLFAGGSAVNVLAMLHLGGWKAYPIGRIGNDQAGKYFIRDLNSFQINLSYIYQRRNDATPVYVLQQHGENHSFVRECPFCHKAFPHYTAILDSDAEAIAASLPDRIDVFYLERVAPGAVKLAKKCKKKGAILFFEPNRVDDEPLFIECLKQAEIVKYSEERLHFIKELTDEINIPLEIETLSKDGLQFRIFDGTNRTDWIHMPPYQPEVFIDSAGAGDWLSSVLIENVGAEGAAGFRIEMDRIRTILLTGQQKASENCAFAGPRGLMYQEISAQEGTDFCRFCDEPS